MIRVQILLDRERCISGHISETLRPPDRETGEYTLLGKDKHLIDTATTIPGTTSKWVYWLFHSPPSKQTMRSEKSLSDSWGSFYHFFGIRGILFSVFGLLASLRVPSELPQCFWVCESMQVWALLLIFSLRATLTRRPGLLFSTARGAGGWIRCSQQSPSIDSTLGTST